MLHRAAHAACDYADPQGFPRDSYTAPQITSVAAEKNMLRNSHLEFSVVISTRLAKGSWLQRRLNNREKKNFTDVFIHVLYISLNANYSIVLYSSVIQAVTHSFLCGKFHFKGNTAPL